MSTRKAQREATRERVLSAAERLFTARGFGSTTVREIAADASVSVGTVMAVGDKAAILVELFDRRVAALHAARAPMDEPGRAATPPGPLTDELLAVFEPFLALFYSDVDLARQYAATLVTGKYRAAVFTELAAVLRREIGEVLMRAGFPPEAAARGATTLHLAHLGSLFISAGTGARDPSKPVEDLISVVEFLTENQGRDQL
ncbi:TetR/AcrR family transcriptional regulator [Streptomyces sp. NA04227]|uniref:TetR/AcrR family transcriptional regulator n=1 Tax=Streptomyces sp. NA04227 TaxID=2742136 RepID=UPI00159070BC|nr:TetR/AcrR family transcriptional regulator [Streptomyces sp. NA04227]QKW08129.1 TetR/AcrR family transcriptional regulator [Streptomyces sp. NA04227]